MAVVPLSNDQRDQMELHVNDLRSIVGEPRACAMAEIMLSLYEERGGGFPGTGRVVCNLPNGGGETLNAPEKAALMGHINAVVAVIEGGDSVASDAANEMLALFEENALGIPETGRDVTQQQLP